MAQTVLKGLLVTIPFAVSGLAQNCSVSFVPQNITIPASAGSGSFAANVSGLGTCPFTGVGSPSGWLSLNSGNGASTSSGAIVYGFTFGAGAAQPRTGAITVVGGSSSNPGLFTNYLIQILQKGSTFTQLFDDVPSTHAFGDYINLLKGSGVTNGCSATSYCPEASVTREQIAKFIILSILGTDTFTYQATPYFDDVPAGNPLFKYIQKMKELGITSGCSATPALYCPTDVVTRGQTAVFLMRGKFGAVNANSRLLNSTTPYFTDVTSADSQYSFIQKLKDSGITSGCSTTQYCPTNPLTRGQAAVMIIRSYFTPSFAL
ncbi:MAG: S-layer homology domain-containing protein [Bryobacteraceae bacterium]